jgi:hypothetical protein
MAPIGRRRDVGYYVVKLTAPLLRVFGGASRQSQVVEEAGSEDLVLANAWRCAAWAASAVIAVATGVVVLLLSDGIHASALHRIAVVVFHLGIAFAILSSAYGSRISLLTRGRLSAKRKVWLAPTSWDVAAVLVAWAVLEVVLH